MDLHQRKERYNVVLIIARDNRNEVSERKITLFHFSGEDGVRGALGFSVPGILGKKTFSSMNYRTSNPRFTPFTPNSKLQRKFQMPREKITPDDNGCDVFYGDSFRVCRGDDDLVA